MSYEHVEPAQWKAFFDSFSHHLVGRQVEIEIVGLDLGDQIEVAWRPLGGLTYEPRSDTLHVYVNGRDDHIDHAIVAPQEVWAELEDDALKSVVVMDRDGHKQFVRFRDPLALPPAARDTLAGGGPSPAA